MKCSAAQEEQGEQGELQAKLRNSGAATRAEALREKSAHLHRDIPEKTGRVNTNAQEARSTRSLPPQRILCVFLPLSFTRGVPGRMAELLTLEGHVGHRVADVHALGEGRDNGCGHLLAAGREILWPRHVKHHLCLGVEEEAPCSAIIIVFENIVLAL